ncbi:MAG: hypothetical protein ACOX9R_09380 [Armatimonadota bacterium]
MTAGILLTVFGAAFGVCAFLVQRTDRSGDLRKKCDEAQKALTRRSIVLLSDNIGEWLEQATKRGEVVTVDAKFNIVEQYTIPSALDIRQRLRSFAADHTEVFASYVDIGRMCERIIALDRWLRDGAFGQAGVAVSLGIVALLVDHSAALPIWAVYLAFGEFALALVLGLITIVARERLSDSFADACREAEDVDG